ncbi:hypothetical protein BAUCODRAFT_151362 [Baudoinia panamericana UAMH 10762]|uniref:Seipin n=1 Tax=Baudoinia panamericana (strain UAMH 10762) TaxID=717646 RepID=M2MNF8_BAUPA|nr:uncharacterized protein BAUCODRAFT_151362 [Baudoinia panamericana UAMH 10762]EMC92983.1 hypothetical protein BAUCODRAFT_151362 [Baudoinia panamericana UAMH 10762]
MALKYETRDEEPPSGGLIDFVKDLVLSPFRIVFSKTAWKAYLTTFLVISTGLVLLGFAITAYILFYWSYIPRIGFERTIHLQYDNVYTAAAAGQGYAATREPNPYPYGVAALRPDIVSVQPYDVVVELTLPRTPENVDAGNFMLEVALLAPNEKLSPTTEETLHAGLVPSTDSALLARSRRPAFLQYRSPWIELVYKLTELPWYLLNFRSETEKLRITIFEGVEFAKGWRNVPATLNLMVQSTHRLQIYTAKAIFRARFRGLRWLMYNYRFLSAFVFISSFWMTEMIFAGIAWFVVSVFIMPRTQDVKAEGVHEIAARVKAEPEDDEPAMRMSDTERTFPTTSGQQPLRYQAEPRIKQEEDESTVVVPDHIVKAADADIEDEDEDVDFFDSGLGTSLESSSASKRDSVRRRRGRLITREEG